MHQKQPPASVAVLRCVVDIIVFVVVDEGGGTLPSLPAHATSIAVKKSAKEVLMRAAIDVSVVNKFAPRRTFIVTVVSDNAVVNVPTMSIAACFYVSV